MYDNHLLPLLQQVKEAPTEMVEWAVTLGLPIKDAPILATAVFVSTDILVTGDQRHFGNLYNKTIEGVTILTPQSALALFL